MRSRGVRFRASGICLVLVGWLLAMLLAAPRTAEAVSQWTRKYGEPCQTCHAGFPRLNYYGERFKRNGYQDPDAAEADGDTQGKKAINAHLSIDSVQNWFGARINVTPVLVEWNSLTVEGDKRTRVTAGNPNWLQLFVAGNIFKDTSIFIETEVERDLIALNWFYLNFTNLFGSKLVNVQVGQLTPLDFTSYSNRVRMHPEIRSELLRVRSSNGVGDDSIDLSRPRPGIQYYGVAGPVIPFAGVSPGSTSSNQNQFFNYWAGLRLEVTEAMESALEGSSISFHALYGTDACTTGDDVVDETTGAITAVGCSTKQRENDFYRLTPAANLRYGRWDVQAAGSFGHDDNWSLAPVDEDADFSGVNVVGQYFIDNPQGMIVPGFMFDYITSDGPDSIEGQERAVFSPVLSWFPRENFRVALYGDIDVLGTDALHPDRRHRFFMNLRAMF